MIHFLFLSLMCVSCVFGDAWYYDDCPEGEGLDETGVCNKLCYMEKKKLGAEKESWCDPTDDHWIEQGLRAYSETEGWVQSYIQVAYFKDGKERYNEDFGEPPLPVNDGRQHTTYSASFEEAEARCDSEPECLGYTLHGSGVPVFITYQANYNRKIDSNCKMMWVKPIGTSPPSNGPTAMPSKAPTLSPTAMPSKTPTLSPTLDGCDFDIDRYINECYCENTLPRLNLDSARVDADRFDYSLMSDSTNLNSDDMTKTMAILSIVFDIALFVLFLYLVRIVKQMSKDQRNKDNGLYDSEADNLVRAN